MQSIISLTACLHCLVFHTCTKCWTFSGIFIKLFLLCLPMILFTDDFVYKCSTCCGILWVQELSLFSAEPWICASSVHFGESCMWMVELKVLALPWCYRNVLRHAHLTLWSKETSWRVAGNFFLFLINVF